MTATQANTQRRATIGGETGANGEWYEGGKFIATTERGKGKPKKKGSGRQEKESGVWEVAPDGMVSIFRQLAGIELWDRAANTFSFNSNLCGYFATPEAIANRKDKIAKYNAGERWISIPA